MLLAHHSTTPGHDIVDSPFADFLSSSSSPSPSPFLDSTSYQQREEGAYPQLLPSALDYSYCASESDAYIIDSVQTTPYDNTLSPLPASQQYMTNTFVPSPRLRVQQSTPSHGSSSAVTPPPMNEGSNWVQPSWNNFSDQAYLSPQSQQQYNNQSSFRSHKRLSSGSSIASGGPDSPYTQNQAYPQIVDQDTQSASSPHLESYNIYQYAQQYGKPLYAQSNVYNTAPFFNPAFQNLNISSSNDAVSMTAGENVVRQAMANQKASNMIAGQGNPRRSYGGMDGSMGIQTDVPKLDRTVSDVYQDELYDSSMPSTAPTSQTKHPQPQRHNVSQTQLLSPSYHSVFNTRLKEADTARSVSPSTNLSRERSPFRDDSEFAGQTFSSQNPSAPATTITTSAAQMRQQQKQIADAVAFAQHHPPAPHDFGVAPKTISPKEALLDYEDEAEDDAKLSALPQIKREPDFSSALAAQTQFVRGNTHTSHKTQTNNNSTGVGNDAQDYASTSSGRRRTPNFSSSQESSSSYTFMAPSNSTSGPPPQYPFISHSRRQSSSMRSGQSEQIPEFPASLTSMESTKSDSAQEQNIRPPAFASQETASSQRSRGASPLQRPSDTSAKSGTYTCTSAGCSARFETSSRLQKHRRENHRTSPHHVSTPTTPYSSTSHSNNPQAAANNVSRNNAPGPHKCVRINPSTGKPCNTVFSRSYDLTRHEDTIHNNRKTKVRCQLCTEEKTFSRNDALTRHMKVVHPDVDFPGRNRRRGAT